MTGEVINVPLDAEARLELASMVYSRWGSAFDGLKATKALTWESAGKFCPKGEWPLYHAEQIAFAEKELSMAARLKEAVCKFSPLVLERDL